MATEPSPIVSTEKSLGLNPTIGKAGTPSYQPPPTDPIAPAYGVSAPGTGLLSKSELQTYIKGLNYGEEDDPSTIPTSQMQQLSSSLAALPSSDANELLKGLPSQLSQAVSTQMQSGSSPTSSTTAAGSAPIDSFLAAVNQTLTPFLANQQSLGEKYTSNYGAQMAQALKGASPQLQAAYAVSDPAMQQAMSLQNTMATQNANEAPDFDALVSSITQNTAQQKAQQYAAAELPYTLASQGLSTGGNAVAQGNSQAEAEMYSQLLQQALAGQSPVSASGLSATSSNATAAGQAASQANQNAYTQALLSQQVGS